MRDPLERWRRETLPTRHGQTPGRAAHADGERGESEPQGAIGEPVVVDGPLWRDEVRVKSALLRPYAPGVYGPGAYGSGAYGSGAQGPGAHDPGAYERETYEREPRPPQAYAPGTFGWGTVGPGPYGQGAQARAPYTDQRSPERNPEPWDAFQPGGAGRVSAPYGDGLLGAADGPGGLGGPAMPVVPAAPGPPGAPSVPGVPGPPGVLGVPGANPSPVPPSPRYAQRTARLNRRTKPRRPLRRAALVLLVAVVTASGGTVAWADMRLQRDVSLNTFSAPHPTGAGTNYLIVGSDSREGLSARDRKKLHTGDAGGRRTDSMILMHTGASGTTMLSLPRDSWVTIPSYTHPSTGKRPGPKKNKLNAAYSLGGPKLLIRTIEYNTGLKVDHYAEIGFSGFVNIVNSVGGVPMCLDHDIRDKNSGANLKRGCHTLDGRDALAFVRQRHQEAKGDLGRTQNQQKFLSALAHKAATPHTLLNPSDLYPTISAGLDTLIVDQDMGLRDLGTMFRSVQGVTHGQGERINVPTAGGIATSKGSALRWNEPRAKELFGEIKHDLPVTVRDK